MKETSSEGFLIRDSKHPITYSIYRALSGDLSKYTLFLNAGKYRRLRKDNYSLFDSPGCMANSAQTAYEV